MAYDIFKGQVPKNFAIQGHPPLHSFEYVMAGGGYVKPEEAWGVPREPVRAAPVSDTSGARRAPSTEIKELKLGTPEGFKIFGFQLFPVVQQISYTDWDAAKRWVANLSENIAYTRKVHGQKILNNEEMARWTEFWKRWLLFANKLDTVKRVTQADDSVAAKLLAVTLPGLWISRLIGATIIGTMALMSEDNKRELDKLLHEAWGLYSRFRLLGMSQVAVPYMGDLVFTLRSLPKNPKLADLSKGLREAAKSGERLIDQNTAWWEWKVRPETKGLRDAVAEAKKLADDIDSIAASTNPSAGLQAQYDGRQRLSQILSQNPSLLIGRKPGQVLRQMVVNATSKIYIEAAGLYGIQETKETARAETKEEAKKGPERAASTLGWMLAAIGAGYLGIKLLTREKVVVVAPEPNSAYHPGEWIPTNIHHEYEREDSHEF